MGAILEVTNWCMLFENCGSDINALWSVFERFCINLIDAYVPWKTVSNRRKPRYPRKIRRLLAKKKKAFMRRSVSPLASEEYKAAAAAYTEAVRNFHYQRECRFLRNPDINGFYGYVNQKLSGTAKNVPICLEKNDETIDDNLECAKIFGEQYSSVFIQDDGTLPDMPAANVPPISDFLITCVHVRNAIKRIKLKSVPGPDQIPSRFLKKFSLALCKPLQIIFQTSFNNGVLPDIWKQATVSPVFKGKGHNRKDPSAYRPVSLTCVCCKLLESILKEALTQHFVNYNVITPEQHGFRAKMSTQTQLLECTNYWTLLAAEKEPVDVVYLDISKAFDTVSHQKLLFKLSRFG
jgi:hypothetical protein